jgi:hypothetical protein
MTPCRILDVKMVPKMTNEERVADFAERVEMEPEGVRSLAENGRYLSVHPMADEEDLLAALGIAASSCIKVDLYWEFAGDVRFVQIQTVAYAEVRPPGIYARVASTGRINVVIFVDDMTISSVVVADALKRAAEARIDERTLTTVLTRL